MTLPITAQWIGVTTLGGHVSKAVAFAARTDIWGCIGKPTEWTGEGGISDSNPPVPDPTATSPNEPIFASKASLQLVVPDNAGAIQVYGQKWTAISSGAAQGLGCRWVLVQAPMDYNKAPINAYDSYVVTNTSSGIHVPVFNADGYQVGDSIQLGYSGQQTTVSGVNTSTDVLTIADTLTSPLIRGDYVTILSASNPFQWRQFGILGNVTSSGTGGQTLLPIAMLSGYSLEYLYNATPIPRSLGRREVAQVVLTF